MTLSAYLTSNRRKYCQVLSEYEGLPYKHPIQEDQTCDLMVRRRPVSLSDEPPPPPPLQDADRRRPSYKQNKAKTKLARVHTLFPAQTFLSKPQIIHTAVEPNIGINGVLPSSQAFKSDIP